MRRGSLRPRAKAKKGVVSKATLDALFSQYIRSKDTCEFHGMDGVRCSTQLQCMHLKSRRFLCIRWNPLNAMCGCAAHHAFYTDHPDLFVKAVEFLAPGRWGAIQILWNEGKKPDMSYLAAWLRGELKGAA